MAFDWSAISARKRGQGCRPQSGYRAMGVVSLSLAVLLCGLVHAFADTPNIGTKPAAAVAQTQPPAQSQGTPLPAAVPSPATISQPLTLQAGTGVLLRLPQPAATVMSAEPSVARVQPASPTTLFLMGVAAGRTTVIATTETGQAIVQYDVTVTPGGGAAPAAALSTGTVTPAMASSIQATIARVVQGASGLRVQGAGNAAVLNGTVPNAAAAQQAEAIARGYVGEKAGVQDNLTVLGAIQVNVRVRIAEINRSVTRQLGFNWQALGNGPGWRFGLLTGAAISSTISPLLPLGLAPLSGATAAPNQLGAGLTSGNKLWDVNGIIDALAGDQLITILAEPNLTALSGETASFLAGGEFPIPIAGNTSNGQTTITVDFKTFGVSLAVVPTVLSPARLNLRVRPEVSQLSSNGAVSVPIAGGTLTIPALTVRRAETTVELGSGQSFAIAGLLEKTSVDNTNALPWIGEVPVIGALFKSNDFQRGESELVIIVTPYIVQPAAGPSALRLPTDNFRPATDLERIIWGRQVASGPAAAAPLDAGFILK
ncbi:MAG TPA: type II and III secretion system protein family protein [Acetobacteraceae bacterium]|nr:type II and III secretion system protein family protein [Acetobacteraceae bacterium]